MLAAHGQQSALAQLECGFLDFVVRPLYVTLADVLPALAGAALPGAHRRKPRRLAGRRSRRRARGPRARRRDVNAAEGMHVAACDNSRSADA
jgi:hypothetical protein